ncbi:MAG: TIGR01906 family membrane protein [Anaerolineae bacterium]|nr:TIGR01906 family membrane protein [Anaerolineae bacterium]
MTTQPRKQPSLLMWALRLLFALSIPVLLILVNVRLVMTPVFLQFEYNRPDFPEDFYGFTREDRIQYAPFALNYLFNDADVTYLGDLEFPDGSALFNARELHHMRDVKIVTRYAFGFAVIWGLVAIGIGLVLRRANLLRQALMSGAILTIGLLLAIVVVAIVNWEFFFTGFHGVFFEQGTWYFQYSDTLIRLFPERFWFDASLLIGGLTIIESVGLLAVLFARR